MKTRHSLSRHLILTATVGAFAATVALLPNQAAAQGTSQERSACMGDAFEFCSANIPDVPKIEACLMQNRSKLSPSCRAEFEPAGRTRLQPAHFK